MTSKPIHLHNSATLLHTRAGDITLRISWLDADLARDTGIRLVVEFRSDRQVDGVRYHLQCHVNLDNGLLPRSIGPADAFPSPPTRDRLADWEERREAVRVAGAADVAALAPELITAPGVLRLYRYGADARVKSAGVKVQAARQKLADAEEEARRPTAIREDPYAHNGAQA